MPGMADPNFSRTVVFMMEHTPEGAVGLVLNRPTRADLLDLMPGWWSAAANPRVVFMGGPVGDGGGIGLARGGGSTPLQGWPEVLGVRAVDLEDEPGPDNGLEARIFAGYSGWGPGQLESELDSDLGWFVVEARTDDVFTPHPERLWEEVLGLYFYSYRSYIQRISLYIMFVPSPPPKKKIKLLPPHLNTCNDITSI